ncbi:exodeoxyribonuclease VII large subunit [Marinomonas sp. S3726]|uniref:exodeoxyribonuclease VII large subunit n=1 Tax=Marinomonas sp. S3726 TaxID=579484 RepID=UPI0005FA81CC|nr:exodeoxyribonuclease VII large subunit [Marinomonas sp. S3726]KJZ14590.1 exodeoxyribonuclease VII large subunit [Marinomonas sp. S3726]
MNFFTAEKQNEVAFSVSQLNRQIQTLLEASLPWVLVEGEISNLARPGSGHWYFSLKDSKAQIRCAMFKNRNNAVRFKPKDGDLVKLRAKVTFYGPRGDCQLTVESMESGGEGALQQAYERLKAQLEAEGLFKQEHKKPLPTTPERVAIITSPIGAAVRDMISAFKRRFPLTELTIIPSLVQGQGAAQNLTKQLIRMDASDHFDAIIIGRGGGSLEDLYSFNDETLARTIFNAKTPIISAVGHEVDFTIADFVADVRAATPTAAAELLSPDSEHLIRQIQSREDRLALSFERQLQTQQQKLDHLIQRMRHPSERIQLQQDKLSQLERRLQQSMQALLNNHKVTLAHSDTRLSNASPAQTLKLKNQQLEDYQRRLSQALKQNLEQKTQTFASLVEKLNLVSPLQILSRGYAIASNEEGVIKNISQTKKGEKLKVRVEDGELNCEVISKKKSNK